MRYVRNDNVLWRRLNARTVIVLSSTSGEPVVLTGVSATSWLELETPKLLDDLPTDDLDSSGLAELLAMMSLGGLLDELPTE